MKIALVQQHATEDKSANLQRGLAAAQAAIDAGGVDEVAMRLANAPASLRYAPGFADLKKQLIRSAEETRAAARARAREEACGRGEETA